MFMLKIRFASDLHLDAYVEKYGRHFRASQLWLPAHDTEDKNSVFVVPGDIWHGLKSIQFGQDGFSWLGALSARFKAVVVVLGNHDAWYERLPRIYHKFNAALQTYANVHLLEAGVGLPAITIGGVRFVGSTLWTDMGRGDPVARQQFDYTKGMDNRFLWNDRNHIRMERDSARFSSADMMMLHARSLAGLRKQLDEDIVTPTVLVTHMGPTMMSTRNYDAKPGDKSNFFYASDISDLILDHSNIVSALHGHTHTTQNYEVGDHCLVQCNPRGYLYSLNVDFDEQACVVISDGERINFSSTAVKIC
jgi:predicted phosphohydrolase